MAWLTGYTYRQEIPIANPESAGDRAIDDVPFAAWFLKNKGKINCTNYEDVHVTKSDGTSELPVSLNTTKNRLFIDYPSMPKGRTKLYVYYGKVGATAPMPVYYLTSQRDSLGIVTISSVAQESGTLVDNGFEGRADGVVADTNIWSLSGTPQKCEYDTSQAKFGTSSLMIQGAISPVLGNAGATEVTTGGMTANTAEIRFWLYCNNTTDSRPLMDYSPGLATAERALYINWTTAGTITATSGRAYDNYIVGSNQIGTYSAGWMEYKIVYNFTSQTYQFSRRANVYESWTKLKLSTATGYDIPFYGTNNITQTHGTLWRAYGNGYIWLDDLRYSNTGIVDKTRVSSATRVGPTTTDVTFENIIDTNLRTATETASNYKIFEHFNGNGGNGRSVSAAVIQPDNKTVRLTHATSILGPLTITVGSGVSGTGCNEVVNTSGFEILWYGRDTSDHYGTGYYDLESTNGSIQAYPVMGNADGVKIINARIGNGSWYDIGSAVPTGENIAVYSGGLISGPNFYVSGTASGGSSTRLYDTTKSWADNIHTGSLVRITAGTGSGQMYSITGNGVNYITVGAWFGGNPDNTSVYEIVPFFEIRLGSGTSIKFAIANDFDASTFYRISASMYVGPTNATALCFGDSSNPLIIKKVSSATPEPHIHRDLKVKRIQAMGANDERTEGVSAGTFYLWGNDLDATYINSAATTTCYNTATSHKVGYKNIGSEKYHYLLKFFEGGLFKGTISSAKLHLYNESASVGSNDSFTVYRNANVGHGTTYGVQYIASGWAPQDNAPTWVKRLDNWQPNVGSASAINWQTAGGTNADEIDTGSSATLNVMTLESAGYKEISIPTAWFDAWIGSDYYSEGFLIQATNEATDDCYMTITAPSQTNSPVIEVIYSAYDPSQYSKRKLDTYTNWVVGPYAGEKLINIASDYSFGVYLYLNANMKYNFVYFDEYGRTHRYIKDHNVSTPVYPANSFYWKAPPAGLHHDPVTGRYWAMVGTSESGGIWASPGMGVAYSDPYVPDNWTWRVPPVWAYASKGGMAVYNDTIHIVNHYGSVKCGVNYMSYDRTADNWLETGGTEVYERQVVMADDYTGLTERTLATQILNTDVMTDASPGTITLNGSPDSYPSCGCVHIDYECFWYTGKSGNTLTGVKRDVFNTTAATHNVGATVELQVNEIGAYVNLTMDNVNSCFHISFTTDITNWHKDVSTHIGPSYTGIYYARHYYADNYDVWYDHNGNLITLPMRINNLPRISGTAFGAWNHNLLSLSNGSTLITYGEQNNHDDSSGIGENNATLTRLNNTSLIGTQSLGMYATAVNMSEIGGGKVVFVGTYCDTENAFPNKIYYLSSPDYGATLSAPVQLADHSSVAAGMLWFPSATEGNMGGFGMVAYQHLNYTGAVYLQTVEFIPIAPSGVTAVRNGTDINVTWTDNSTTEEGFYIDVSENGGAWTTLNHTVPVDSQNYTHSGTSQLKSYKYRIAAYAGTTQSAWVESNTVAVNGNSMFFGINT